MQLNSIKEFKEKYISLGCDLYRMEKDNPNYLDDMRELNISNETLKSWNEEYVEEHITNFNKNDSKSIFDLKRDIYLNLDYSYIIRMFDNFKLLLDEDNLSISDKLEYLLDIHFSTYPHKEPFMGFLGLAIYNKDYDRLNEMREIYINLLLAARPKDGIDSYKIFIIFSLAYDLDYHLDELNRKYALRAKKAFDEDLYEGESLWPMICYLTGIAVEENYKNAYRALKLTYDKHHETSDDFLSYLSFINYIAKMNYTVDDVLRLESLQVHEPLPELSEIIGLYPGEM